MLKAIQLSSLIFWDETFIPCPHYNLQLAKKLDLKTKHIKNIIIIERLKIIGENKTIIRLNSLFMAYFDW